MTTTMQAPRKGIGGHTRPNGGATVSWLTPPEILAALGPFDLDPCACNAMPWETARDMWTEGRATPNGPEDWYGTVWLNPPYGPALGDWLKLLARHNNGIACVFARTETRAFFDHVWGKASGLLFLKGRLHFHRPDGTRAKGNAGGPTVLIACGPECHDRLKRCGLEGAFVGTHRLNPSARP